MGRRLLGAFLACVLALAAVPQVCLACSCRMLPPDEALAKADMVFRGRVVRTSSQAFRRYDASGAYKEMAQLKAVFAIDTVWKGPAVPMMSIAQGVVADLNAAPNLVTLSSCDVSFSLGSEYLVFGTWQSDARDRPLLMMSHYCYATRETKYASE